MTADSAPPPLFRTAWFRAALALGGAGWLALVWSALCTVPGVPWNPAITIVSEWRVYPLDDALYCLWTARLEPPPEKIRATVPADALRIYHEPPQSKFVERYTNSPSLTKPKSTP